MPYDLTLDMAAALWAVRRFAPGASDATAYYINPYAVLGIQRPDTLLINLPPYAKRGAIMPTPSPDGGPGSCFRSVIDRYSAEATRIAMEPLVVAIESAMQADANFDPEAPISLRNADIAMLLRGTRRSFSGFPERDDRTREAMEPAFDALYALLGIRS